MAPELVGAAAEFLLDFTCYRHRADIFRQDRDLRHGLFPSIRKIGYKEVCDSVEYTFKMPDM